MSPYSIILIIIFLFIVLGYAIGSFFILYHLIRFGVGTGPKQIALLFMVGSIVLLFITAIGFVASYPSIEQYVSTIQVKQQINLDSLRHRP